MDATIREGQLLVLLGPEGERHVMAAGAETKRVAGLGVIDLAAFVGRPWGTTTRLGLKEYRIVQPVLADHLLRLERRAQIITVKDASRILLETGLGAGDRVVEAGVGSGALTMVLAHAVFPTGRVYAYDLRQEHLDVGRRNLERTPWSSVVDLRLGDVRQPLDLEPVDAFVLDVPDPEAAVANAAKVLRSGGVFAAYTPQITQAQAVTQALAEHGFVQVRTLETLEREWVFPAQGARPSFDMLGHTAFLTFARAATTHT